MSNQLRILLYTRTEKLIKLTGVKLMLSTFDKITMQTVQTDNEL